MPADLNFPTSSIYVAPFVVDEEARTFCGDFLNGTNPKYVFGRNEYAESIVRVVEVDGFIDDFTVETEFLGKPIIRTENVPGNALVVSVVTGRPFVAEKRLDDFGIQHLDYFAFKRYAPCETAPVKFWDEFGVDFEINRDRYERIYGLLQDTESKVVLNKIINFRLSYNINFMRGFSDIQHRQYFEDFLALKREGEVFVDVGGYDGYTSLEFAGRCPGYGAIHVFEPEPGNMAVVEKRLAGLPGVILYPLGLSNRAQILRFETHGSCSRVSHEGNISIEVKRLDDIIQDQFTFLKMDIEGGEMAALEGARQAIARSHPRLAISVYHRFDDLWRIPEFILGCRDDYLLFLRHYTEGVDETVMFFMPCERR